MPILVGGISHCNCYCRNVGEELAEEGDHVGAMGAIAQTKFITQVRREGEERGGEGKGREGKERGGEGREGEGKGRGDDVVCLWITIIHCWCWPLINSSDYEEKCNPKLHSNCYCHQTCGQFNGTL